MKVSDFIVEYLIGKGISDVFGYPGGMVTHLMDSFSKYKDQISAHVAYHEQAAAFMACGYAQVSGKPGVAYATSGPGATNLITGICNAYFDSIPTIFITGQVNTFESRGEYNVRQRGFQETDIISIVSSVTKYSQYVESAEKIKYYLDYAYYQATSGRMGPVLLDIPMNIFRAEIDVSKLQGYNPKILSNSIENCENEIKILIDSLKKSKHPCCLIGNGMKISRNQDMILDFCHKFNIPIVTSMIAFDVANNDSLNYGFVGAYGDRVANFIVAKSDLLITIGSRLDVRQVGAKRDNFAPNAKMIRFDIDDGELSYRVHNDEIQIYGTLEKMKTILKEVHNKCNFDYSSWISVCDCMKSKLKDVDTSITGNIISKLSERFQEDAVITTDVGQNQVWVAQSAKLKKGQQVLFSGGLGAMGYSLPAAIGAYYASKKSVICISGDGGMQMNIQEFQFIVREKLPIKVIVLNNNALGMIRHFQEMYFNKNYFQTKPSGGYVAPFFSKIANAYGIGSKIIAENNFSDKLIELSDNRPFLLEVLIKEDTYVFPKLEFGKPNQDQEPLLERDLYNQLMMLGEDDENSYNRSH